MMKYSFSVFVLLVFTLNLWSQSKNSDFKKEICTYRETYKAKFLKDSRAPLTTKKELKYLRFFKPDDQFLVKCKIVEIPEAKPFEMATYSGDTHVYQKFTDLKFEIAGKEYQLSAYKNIRLQKMPGYKDYLFVPFKDLTNGDTTYGGGRYMDLDVSNIKNAMIDLDFNKSYNPWCHYKDGYSCPIPPSENHLKIMILAGEKNFAKSK